MGIVVRKHQGHWISDKATGWLDKVAVHLLLHRHGESGQ